MPVKKILEILGVELVAVLIVHQHNIQLLALILIIIRYFFLPRFPESLLTLNEYREKQQVQLIYLSQLFMLPQLLPRPPPLAPPRLHCTLLNLPKPLPRALTLAAAAATYFPTILAALPQHQLHLPQRPAHTLLELFPLLGELFFEHLSALLLRHRISPLPNNPASASCSRTISPRHKADNIGHLLDGPYNEMKKVAKDYQDF